MVGRAVIAEQTFEYQGQHLTVLQLARIVLPGPDQVSEPFSPPSLGLSDNATPTADQPGAGSGRFVEHEQDCVMTDREVFLWYRAVKLGLAICAVDHHVVVNGECGDCDLNCRAAGVN